MGPPCRPAEDSPFLSLQDQTGRLRVEIAGQDKQHHAKVAGTPRLEPVFAERRIFGQVVIDQHLAKFTIQE